MWKINNCGCKDFSPKPIEFPIIDTEDEKTYIKFYYPDVNDLCELKQKTINNFLDIFKKLECGIQPDLEFLLEEISVIYNYEEL